MAARVATGTFLSSVGAVGTQFKIVTSDAAGSFAPVGIFIYTIGFTSDPTPATVAQSDLRSSFGFASKPDLKQAVVGAWQKNAVATTETRRWFDNANIGYITNNDTLDAAFELFTWDVDGVTFRVTNQGPTFRRFYFIAFGGDLDAGMVIRQLPLGAGNFDTTGFGFGPTEQPEALLTLTFARDTAFPGTSPWAETTFGIVVDATQQGYLGWGDRDNVATSEAASSSNNLETNVRCRPNGAIEQRLTFVSWLNDGVRLNLAEPNDDDWIFMLALRNGDFALKEFLTATSAPTTIPITGLPSRPAGGILLSSYSTEDAADASHPDELATIGVFHGTAGADQHVGLMQSLDGEAGSRCGHGAALGSIYVSANKAHPAAKVGEGKVLTIGPTNVDLQQTLADPIQYFGMLFTVGPAAVTAPVTVGGSAQGLFW